MSKATACPVSVACCVGGRVMGVRCADAGLILANHSARSKASVDLPSWLLSSTTNKLTTNNHSTTQNTIKQPGILKSASPDLSFPHPPATSFIDRPAQPAPVACLPPARSSKLRTAQQHSSFTLFTRSLFPLFVTSFNSTTYSSVRSRRLPLPPCSLFVLSRS